MFLHIWDAPDGNAIASKNFATDEYAMEAYTMYAFTNVSIRIWLNGMTFHGMWNQKNRARNLSIKAEIT